jgi:uncharacterized membrane protein
MSIGIQPHPFYEPLWRRILIVVFVAAWFGFEIFLDHNGMWTTIAGAMLAYCVYAFLIAYPQSDKNN